MANSPLKKEPTIKHITITKSMVGISDFNITKSDIKTEAGASSEDDILLIIPEGVRPTTTWSCCPLLVYVETKDLWAVHNIGNTSDTVKANFTVLLK